MRHKPLNPQVMDSLSRVVVSGGPFYGPGRVVGRIRCRNKSSQKDFSWTTHTCVGTLTRKGPDRTSRWSNRVPVG